jgi:hypothetical protein
MDTPMSDDVKKTITTAEFLGKFHKELADSGLPSDLISKLVVRAADTVLENDGISVRGGE